MKILATLALLAALPFSATQNHGRSATASQNTCNSCPPPPAVVAAFLGFTDAQATQFIALESQFQSALCDVEQQGAGWQHELDTLLSQPNPNPAVAGQLVLQIHALQQQVAQIVQNYQAQFAGLLTMEQKQKIQEVTLASQLQPVVGAFASLYLVPAPPPAPCPQP